jgi:hypothetical protein
MQNVILEERNDEESAFAFRFPGLKNWEKRKADASLRSA